jgi:PIN domain nuclease of toxin-antitoxin system
VNILIDTHIFLWATSNRKMLSKVQMDALQTPYNQIYVRAISITEIIIKVSIGKLISNVTSWLWRNKADSICSTIAQKMLYF